MSFLKRKSVALLRQLNLNQPSVEELHAIDHAELTVRLEQLDRIQDQFESTQSQLEEEDPNELDANNHDEFAATFIRNKAAFTRELNKVDYQPMSSTGNPPPQEQPSVVIVKQPRSRLPELQLPQFGDSELLNLEKFQHLRSCLKGAALETIQSLEIRDENYITALNLLVERFDNRHLIFQALRQGLQSLGTTEQIADCLLQHITAQKLDATTHTLWEERVSTNRLPPWTDTVTFLHKRCQAMENVAHAMVTKTPSTQTAQKICAVYNKHDYVVYSCPVFASISPNECWKKARNVKLCINCLKPGHQVQQCKSSACRRCSLMHHTLLHFNQMDQTNLRPPEG
ncbi:uncharacterized protein LOC128869694 [Anastrepha ludens]|uniref:uncharacterized protein LOC128869694 n=1 Tax=Anastrepha ludens TaxID=28586 RepID=UPI0023AEB7EB|nr:uncharacterized protein LOC128869694 [Anastrepha ludens]